MKIAVMGAGGVGGYFGGLLARAGEDVTFIARGGHLKAIRRSGLRVLSDLSGEFTVASPATDDVASVGAVDLVLHTVKMYHNEVAIPALTPMVGPDTVVLTLQNGVGNGPALADALGQGHVMVGAAFLSGRITAPGVVSQFGQFGRVVFGEMAGGVTDRGQRLLEVFGRAGWSVELSDNAPREVWQKFVYLTGAAGINAITQASYGEMRSVPETRDLIREAFAEIVDVTRASGVSLHDDVLDRAMEALDGFPHDAMASLTRDFMDGNRVELEGLTGAVVRMGRELGVPTPVNDTVYALLRPAALRIERRFQQGRAAAS